MIYDLETLRFIISDFVYSLSDYTSLVWSPDSQSIAFVDRDDLLLNFNTLTETTRIIDNHASRIVVWRDEVQ